MKSNLSRKASQKSFQLSHILWRDINKSHSTPIISSAFTQMNVCPSYLGHHKISGESMGFSFLCSGLSIPNSGLKHKIYVLGDLGLLSLLLIPGIYLPG
jgi:hypothetical protein